MSKSFRRYGPEQIFLMPASLQDWLPKGHLTYFVSEVVSSVAVSLTHSQLRSQQLKMRDSLLIKCDE